MDAVIPVKAEISIPLSLRRPYETRCNSIPGFFVLNRSPRRITVSQAQPNYFAYCPRYSVLVAAAHSRNGASFQLLSMVPSRGFEIALTVALYTEWQAVLTRAEHLPLGAHAEAAQAFLGYLASVAHLQDVHFLWRPFLRDPDDDMVLECAVASGSAYIVTHNVKDFLHVEDLKVQAITPGDFLRLLRSRS